MSFGLIAPPALLADPAGADPAGKRALTAAIGDRRPLPPVDCIDPQQIRSTRIVAGTGTGIVYEVNGRLYVQRSQAGAAALRDGDVLVSRIAGGELCQRDAVAGAGRRAAGAQGPLLRVDAVLDEAGADAAPRCRPSVQRLDTHLTDNSANR